MPDERERNAYQKVNFTEFCVLHDYVSNCLEFVFRLMDSVVVRVRCTC